MKEILYIGNEIIDAEKHEQALQELEEVRISRILARTMVALKNPDRLGDDLSLELSFLAQRRIFTYPLPN